MNDRRRRVLLAKTALDGHWRGLSVVSHALRNAGFEVILAGMATPEEVVAAARQEDVALVGLNVGGHIAVAERVIHALHESSPGLPIIAGGTLPPSALERLQQLGVRGFPPGSSLASIVEEANRLIDLNAD